MTSSTSTSGTRSAAVRPHPAQRAVQRGLAGAPGDRRGGRRTCRSRASPRCPGWSWSGVGGLRLHEEVFLTGIRIRGQAMSEAKAEEVLDTALDAEDLVLADEDVRRELADLWNGDGTPLRTRLLTAMEQQGQGTPGEGDRRDSTSGGTPTSPGHGRSSPRSASTCGSRATGWTGEIRGEEEKLFPDDQQRQRRRDLASMDRPPGQPGRRGAA